MADQTPPPAPVAPVKLPAAAPRVRAEPIPDSPKAEELARREATGFAEDSLDGISRKNEHSRREQLRSVVHYCSLALIVLLTGLAGVAVVVWALQYMLPESWAPATRCGISAGRARSRSTGASAAVSSA